MKIYLMAAQLSHADRKSDMTKEIVALHNSGEKCRENK